jgi:hypothetical protein
MCYSHSCLADFIAHDVVQRTCHQCTQTSVVVVVVVVTAAAAAVAVVVVVIDCLICL